MLSNSSYTASQKGYNIANDKTPQRRTFTNPTSEGDQRNLYGQGKPMAKNSSGAGADWYLGTEAESLSAGLKVNSRTMFEGTVAPTDMDRATDAREKGRIGIFGTGNAYAGSSGRVTSERIGRDLNPLGRGDGSAYVGGAFSLGNVAPQLPFTVIKLGSGNSVNNSGCIGCGSSGGGLAQYSPPQPHDGGIYGNSHCCAPKCHPIGCCPEKTAIMGGGGQPLCPCCPEIECGGQCKGIAGIKIQKVPCHDEEMDCNLEFHPCQNYNNKECNCMFSPFGNQVPKNGLDGCEAWKGAFWLLWGLYARKEGWCCIDHLPPELQPRMEILVNTDSMEGPAWGFARDLICCALGDFTDSDGKGDYGWTSEFITTYAEEGRSACQAFCGAGVKGYTPSKNEVWKHWWNDEEEVPEALIGHYLCWDNIVGTSGGYSDNKTCEFIATILHEGLRGRGAGNESVSRDMLGGSGGTMYGLSNFVKCLCHKVILLSHDIKLHDRDTGKP